MPLQPGFRHIVLKNTINRVDSYIDVPNEQSDKTTIKALENIGFNVKVIDSETFQVSIKE